MCALAVARVCAQRDEHGRSIRVTLRGAYRARLVAVALAAITVIVKVTSSKREGYRIEVAAELWGWCADEGRRPQFAAEVRGSTDQTTGDVVIGRYGRGCEVGDVPSRESDLHE